MRYFYQGREVQLKGQLGDSIYEIQDTSSADPARCLQRGNIFTVARSQVEERGDTPPPAAEAVARASRKKAEEN